MLCYVWAGVKETNPSSDKIKLCQTCSHTDESTQGRTHTYKCLNKDLISTHLLRITHWGFDIRQSDLKDKKQRPTYKMIPWKIISWSLDKNWYRRAFQIVFGGIIFGYLPNLNLNMSFKLNIKWLLFPLILSTSSLHNQYFKLCQISMSLSLSYVEGFFHVFCSESKEWWTCNPQHDTH